MYEVVREGVDFVDNGDGWRWSREKIQRERRFVRVVDRSRRYRTAQDGIG
jgi:hypothetical protein